jgi:uncharacterized protein with HEPN domain
MSEHDDRLPMIQMLEHAREAVEIVSGRSRLELSSNRVLQLALQHLVQIVGEAAGRVSREGKAKYPDVPWVEAISTRHRIVHDYDRVNYDILWDTIAVDFPVLVAALERALASESR